MVRMEGESTHLVLATALGATLLLLGCLAAVGGRRTLGIVRAMGISGLFVALFVGVALETLAPPTIASKPYTLAFLPSTALRAEGLAQDPDLRTRYNVDPRLRYLGGSVANLESDYAPDLGPLRRLEVPPVVHSTPRPLPKGVVAMGEAEFGKEVDGLYERAWASVDRTELAPAAERTAFLGTASVGFLLLGLVGLLAGILSLLLRGLSALRDHLRLLWMTADGRYQGVRARALRLGSRELLRWHLRESRPFVSLLTFGLLVALGGALLGLLREEETRSLAHAVFREARDVRFKDALKRP